MAELQDLRAEPGNQGGGQSCSRSVAEHLMLAIGREIDAWRQGRQPEAEAVRRIALLARAAGSARMLQPEEHRT
jgi:hypothetical protein